MKLDDIRALPDAHDRVQRLFTRLIPLAQERRFATMPAAAQRFFAAFEWVGEVHNGGVRQYFSNSAGDRWRLALSAFEAMGDVDGARVFQAALALFPAASPPEKRWDRQDVLEALDRGAFAPIERDAATTRDATLAHLARMMETDADALRFIDAHPSGLKALELPADLTIADATDAEDPFVVVTSVYALLARGVAPPFDAATFLDAFGVLDEVSVGGFATYLAHTQAGRRWREAVKALHTIGVPAHAALLERAAAAHAAGTELVALDGEHQDSRSDLATALAAWIKRSMS